MSTAAAGITASSLSEIIEKATKAATKTAMEVSEYARAIQVRESPVYDYEKVFWNSLYTIGLLGLGYVAIKIGQAIQTLQRIVTLDFLPTLVATYGPEYTDDFLFVYEYMDGYKKDVATPTMGGRITWGFSIQNVNRSYINYRYRLVYYYREEHPEEWETWKAEFYAAGGMTEEDVKAQSKAISDRVRELEAPDFLGQIATFYSEYGPYMPLGSLGLHASLEWFRVSKLKRKK